MERVHVSPPVVAVFIVIFDQKVGYTIARKRTIPDIDLDGVEYKSLPSGLHAVKQDLIYFVHGEYAGVSVFVQGEADAIHRNASFVAVGALIPLSHGQLGRGWMYAEELRAMAKEVVKDTTDTRHLELFWKKHRADEAARQHPASHPALSSPTTEGRKRKRAASEATLAGFKAEGTWPKDHPALSMPAIFNSFGPLIFPLHRAALLRKRLLFLGSTPVQQNCNTVYDASVLSTIPQSLAETLSSQAEARFQCRPLFSVGIQDMPALTNSEKNKSHGWLACTTDDILGEKNDLYDLLIELPSISRSKSHWPNLRTSDGKIIKATQRDHRRWRQLRHELRRLREQSQEQYSDDPGTDQSLADDEQPLLDRTASQVSNTESTAGVTEVATEVAPPSRRDVSHIVEPSSWSALAYRGFMWWASAGEASAWENDQAQADEELLSDLPDVANLLSATNASSSPPENDRELQFSRAAATIIVAYFRRVTELILKRIGSIVEEADDNTEEGIEEESIPVSMDDVREMGLDTWSHVDKVFVAEMMNVWFEREAVVGDGGVRFCGLRIC